ncbi:MAG TPA: histidine kinase [Acetobacteraceae bacterium]|jgi:NodT family efflux transporter outer membrane factor (OMF) lipoprotein|nr:histidine kinase [Acetobacteraceae bacterium]
MTARPLTALPLILTLLGGCAVGPDFQTPQAPAAAGYGKDIVLPPAGDTTQRLVPDGDVAADWWHIFQSEPLNTLVRQALATNPTIAAGQAALRQALENVAAQRGFFYPSVSAGVDASRNLTPLAAVSPAGPNGNPYYSLITPQLNVSFAPDVFGANRRALESLQAQADNQRFMLEATWVTLTSNIVAAAIQEGSLRGQIQTIEQTVRIETDLLTILRAQQRLGQVSGGDVAAQEAALAQAQQQLPPLRKQLAQQRDALIALAGRFPDEDITQTFDLTSFRLPAELPVSLPADLVKQRPDVRQAEENLHAASANIGQAVAARLPQITLTAQVGNSANSAGNLFTPGTNFWSLTGGLTQPLFDGFALMHRQRAAQAAFDQAAAQYQGTVLSAFQNVADALRALQSDADAVNAASAAEQAAGRSLVIARKQLQLGQVAYLTLLNAENTYAQARLLQVQAQAARLADTAALFQALGGGWWHRIPAAENTLQKAGQEMPPGLP